MLLNNGIVLFTIVLTTAISPGSSLPKPVDLTFTSLNLRTELRWRPGRKSPEQTHYSVDYAIYGDKEEGGGKRLRWRAARLCRDIARTWCDLTNETSDLEEGYFARVRATASNSSSNWTIVKRRFDPKHDTVLGPPLVSVKVQDTTAVVQLKGPMRWPIQNQTSQVPMSQIYPQMTFNLSVYHQDRNQTRHFLLSLQSLSYEYPLMEYDTEYCFSAKAHFLSLPLLCLASEWHCIHTPPDPVVGQILQVLLGVVVPSVCLLLLLTGWLLYRSVQGKEHKSPHTLKMSHAQTPPRTFSPEKVNIVIFHLSIESTMDMPDAPKPAPLVPTLPTPPGKNDTLSPPSFAVPQPPCTPAPDAFCENEVPEHKNEEVEYGHVVFTPQQDKGQTQSHYRRQDHSQSQGQGQGQGQTQSHYRRQDHSQSQGQGQSQSQYRRQDHSQSQGQGQSQSQYRRQDHSQSQGQGQSQDQTHSQVQGQSVEKPDEENVCARIHLERGLHTGLFHIPLPGPLLGLGRWGEREEESETLLPYAPQLGAQMLKWSSNAQQVEEEGEVKEEGGWEQEEEEEGGHCVDWSPKTRKLHVPFLPCSWDKVKEETESRMGGGIERGMDRWMGGGIEAEGFQGQMDPGEILSSVLVRQASQESDPESDITNLQDTWHLQINTY